MASSTDLREIFAAGRPLVEQWLDASEQIAALREVATAKGLDWSQVKALLKAQIQDERDESGAGKRVKAIIAKAEHASAYADMLGLASMNENNYSAGQSCADAKGIDREARRKHRFSEGMDDAKALSAEAARLGLIDPAAHAETERITDALARKYGAGVIDPETGEITEQPETATRPGHDVKSPSQRALAGENFDVTADGRDVEATVEQRPSANDFTDEPEAAADAAGDFLREPVAAEQGQIIREGDAPRETDRDHSGDASCLDADFQPPSFLTREAKPLRPLCQRPDNCGGYGRTHCYSCARAAGAQVDEAAA